MCLKMWPGLSPLREIGVNFILPEKINRCGLLIATGLILAPNCMGVTALRVALVLFRRLLDLLFKLVPLRLLDSPLVRVFDKGSEVIKVNAISSVKFWDRYIHILEILISSDEGLKREHNGKK